MFFTLKQLRHRAYVGVLALSIRALDHYARVISVLSLLALKLEKLHFWLAKPLKWRYRASRRMALLSGLTMKSREQKLCSDAIKPLWGSVLSSSSPTSKATTKNTSRQLEVG